MKLSALSQKQGGGESAVCQIEGDGLLPPTGSGELNRGVRKVGGARGE